MQEEEAIGLVSPTKLIFGNEVDLCTTARPLQAHREQLKFMILFAARQRMSKPHYSHH